MNNDFVCSAYVVMATTLKEPQVLFNNMSLCEFYRKSVLNKITWDFSTLKLTSQISKTKIFCIFNVMKKTSGFSGRIGTFYRRHCRSFSTEKCECLTRVFSGEPKNNTEKRV
jgi:hypothetical protein